MHKQKGFGVIEVVLIFVMVALIGAALYMAFQAGQNKKTNSTVQTSTPSQQEPAAQTTINGPFYALTLPAGWQASVAPNEYVANLGASHQSTGTADYYADSNGNYMAIIINPIGRGFEANETWQLATTATGFTFDSKTTCTPGADFCTPANANEYRIGIKTAAPLDGYDYFFFAGNSKQKTGVNTEVFKTIVESLKAY